MNTQELLQNGGRIVRRRKGKRTITIAYQRNGDEIVYGATIFNKKSSKENYTREGQRQIAINRMVGSGVIIVGAPTFEHIGAQDEFVRRSLIDLGCGGTRKSLGRDS